MIPMKSPILACLIFCALAPLRAADWPSAFEKYESLALTRPVNGTAMWQMWKYVEETERADELKQRWEAKAAGPEGDAYRMLLAFLAELRGDVPEARAQYEKAAAIKLSLIHI